MSACVFIIDLLRALRKGHKNDAAITVITFDTTFEKFNNTGTLIIHSLYHITLNYFKIAFLRRNCNTLRYICNVVMDVFT